jgi:23S rRNA pseudouridine2605 synthase
MSRTQVEKHRQKNPVTVRLNRYLANAGIAARRKCDTLIFDGQVQVNGEVVMEPGRQVDPAKDLVRVGKKEIQPQQEIVVYKVNKPRGVVATAQDEHGRRQVVDLVPKDLRVFPVGRLDYDSSGLILLTNDGDLAHRLTHPRYEVHKVYKVRLAKDITNMDLERLQKGVSIGKGESVAAEVTRVVNTRNRILVTIHEGRNRQIRRMVEAIGHSVKALERIAIADMKLGKLPRGEYRLLSLKEYNRLRKSVGLKELAGS